MEHFFPPNSTGDLRSDAHQSQNIGGDSDVDYSQIIGGNTVKLLGGINHVTSPWVSSPLPTSTTSKNDLMPKSIRSEKAQKVS